jgi:hypothetical protein
VILPRTLKGNYTMLTVSKFIQYHLANDDFGNIVILSSNAYEQIFYFVHGETIEQKNKGV